MKKHAPVIRNIKKTDLVTSPPSLSMPPTTTEQEDIVTSGQRRVNLIWEHTQAFIAVVVILTNMSAGLVFVVQGIDTSNYPSVLSSSLFLVIGFYFSRTNHAAIGGVGKQPAGQKYQGR